MLVKDSVICCFLVWIYIIDELLMLGYVLRNEAIILNYQTFLEDINGILEDCHNEHIAVH